MNSEKTKSSFFDNRYARIITVALATALFYGSWAAYSNWEHGLATALKAGMTQALFFGIAASCSSSLMEFLFTLSNNIVIQYFLSSMGSGMLMLMVAITVHTINGTPNIMQTILPPTLIATPYYMTYPLELARREMKNNPDGVIIKPEFLNRIFNKLSKRTK